MTVLRRQVLRYGAGTAGALALTRTGTAAARTPGRRVAVLGGGPGGLTAAHELAERGFEVTVYERRPVLGGKVRSVPVPGTGTDGRRDLPGEHGHRAVFGFYHNLPDTLRRIPYPGNEEGVYGNLTQVPWQTFVREDGKKDLSYPSTPPASGALTVESVTRMLAGLVAEVGELPPHEAAYFAQRGAILLTSSKERLFGQWEEMDWWTFIRAESGFPKSVEYQRLFGGTAQTLNAFKPSLASTRTCAQGGEAIVYDMLRRGSDGPHNRVFDRPTSEAWVDPWADHLRALGVRFRTGHTVESLTFEGGRITAADARTADGSSVRIKADWFLAGLPADRAKDLWSKEILAADPSLAGTAKLGTIWCQGIQYFLREPTPLHNGHVVYVDSPWALVSIAQGQFWQPGFPATWGDGRARDCLSVVISNWEKPGVLYGKPAAHCTRREVAAEVWAQMKRALEDRGESVLPDDLVHSWHLDPALQDGPGGLSNDEPYLLNGKGSWRHRPETTTAIPNLFICADYARTHSNLDFSSMETANEAGRRAANGVLDAAGSDAERARLFEGYSPPEFALAKRVDAQRYRAGLPHALDLG
ncbi:hydroxysqualene dehydroxylase [Streptomyces cavernicola]|uniref:FAD-dependent oxidoreductase n=1 Tax=Streptomyces cavernicola TaxID=3043613 RepID=A0ABT6S751_9ACTN|nr:FAD-dependent oxidoreductase [Streptomyces sp. B-S-A6]MDI3403924.1 FAD-dependent oxidoreductase [Streptomyces sp. B-S-A6]